VEFVECEELRGVVKESMSLANVCL